MISKRKNSVLAGFGMIILLVAVLNIFAPAALVRADTADGDPPNRDPYPPDSLDTLVPPDTTQGGYSLPTGDDISLLDIIMTTIDVIL